MKLFLLILVVSVATGFSISELKSEKEDVPGEIHIELPPKIWFERNDLQHRTESLELYSSILKEHPKACLQLAHYRHPEETEGIGKKRLKKFEKYLSKEGFPMDRIMVNWDTHEMHCNTYEPCHAQIYFEIVSIDGHCD